MSRSNKKDVIDFLETRNDHDFINQYAVFYKGDIVFLDRKARNIYRSEKLAINAAARHLYTTKEIIHELIDENLIQIKRI